MMRITRRAMVAGVATAVAVSTQAVAETADEAVLTACRTNPELAAVPRAADIGCACAVDAMAPLTPDEKQTIADDGFRPEAFGALAGNHPDLLQAVRDCLEPDQD